MTDSLLVFKRCLHEILFKSILSQTLYLESLHGKRPSSLSDRLNDILFISSQSNTVFRIFYKRPFPLSDHISFKKPSLVAESVLCQTLHDPETLANDHLLHI